MRACDGDTTTCDTASVGVEVANLPSTIKRITTNAPVRQGQPVMLTVEASDPGVNDILSYSFDCDGDGTYDVGPQPNNGATCALDPARASVTINVLVEDGDNGRDMGSVTINQSTTLCANRYTSGLSTPAANGCPSGSVALSVPGPVAMTFCVNPYTGALVWSPSGTCWAGYRTHIAPHDGPLYFCQSLYTGKLRYSATRTCSAGERPGVIPG